MRQAHALKGSISAVRGTVKDRFARVQAVEPFSTVHRLIREVGRDDLSGLAAELSYRLFLTLFPFFIFLAALGGFIAELLNIDNPTEQIMDLLGDNVPSDVASVLRDQIDAVISGSNTGLVSIAIAASIWTASSGVASLMKGMNRIYRVAEKRAVWKRYGIAIGLTLLAGNFLIASFIVMVLGQVYGLRIAGLLGLEGQAARIFTLARLPLSFVVVLLAVDFLYWVAPNTRQRFRLLSPGAVLFTVAWLALNLFFGLYVSKFGTYNATYGALAGVVVVLIWFYLTSFLLFVGVEVDAVMLAKVDKQQPAVVTPPESDAADAAS